MQGINWNERWKDKSVNDMWCDLVQLLKDQVAMFMFRQNNSIKRKKQNCQRDHAPSTGTVLRRSKAWKRYCLYQSGKNWDDYKRIRNEVNQYIREEEKCRRKRILKSFKDQPKKFYGFMRNLQTVKDQVTVLKKRDGEMTTSDHEVADLFSEHFKEVYTVEDLSSVPRRKPYALVQN